MQCSLTQQYLHGRSLLASFRSRLLPYRYRSSARPLHGRVRPSEPARSSQHRVSLSILAKQQVLTLPA